MAEASLRKQPRAAIFRTLAIMASMVLASCAGVVPKGKQGVVAPPRQEEAAIPQVLPPDQRHRIALLVPMTGPNAAVGQSIANAASMALIDTGNKTVRMTTYDTATGAAAAAARAIAEGNRLFLGPLLSEDATAVTPAARSAQIPVISFSNDAAIAGDGVYLMGFSPSQSIDRVVRFAKGKGVAKFAALVPTGAYGRSASTTMIKAVENAGGSLVAMKSYERNAKSMGIAVAQLGKDQDYDGVLIADTGRMATQVAPLIRKSSSPQARILGTELWSAEPALLASPVLGGAWYASVSDARYRQLAQAYRRQFGRAPFRLASLGYDAMLLVVKISGSWRVGDRFPAAKLRDEDGFVGVDGAFRFMPNGVAERSLEVRELSPAGAKTVAAAPAGFRE